MKAVLATIAMMGVVVGCDDASEQQEQILDPAQSGFSVDRTSAIVHEVVTATVVLRDTDGQPIPGLQVTLLATGTLNNLIQPPLTNAAGEASGTWTTTRAEIKSISATLPEGAGTIGPRSVTFLAAAASKLVFQTQPPDVEAGEPMGVEVAFQDADGNLASSIMPVAIRLGANPPAAELKGTLQSSPSVGVANFSGLHVDVAESNFSLIASAMGLPDVESEPFDVAAGAPVATKSSMTASPYSNDADGISAANIAISVRNQYNVPIAGLGVVVSATGTGNIFGAVSATSTAGTTGTTLKSTTAENKVVSANVGLFTLTAPVAFFPPPCTVMLPSRPSVAFESTAKAMVTADFDGDGNVDVADAEQITQNPPHQSMIVIRRGRGDGRFHPGVTVPITGAAASMATADLDGDGDLDLVATVSDQSIAYVLLQSTSANFGAPTPTTLDGAANAIALADVNEDGDIDMVASLVDIDRVAIHLGAGTGAFSAGSLLTVGDYPVSVTAADFNRDGHLDIGVSQFNEVSYSTFLGNGNGTFGTRRTKGATRSGSQIVADVDHDSIPDVILASMQGDGIDVLLGNGDGTFRYEWGYSPGLAAASMALADLNADTHPDLVLGSYPSLVVLSGTGTGEFTPTNRYANASWGSELPNGLRGGLALADADNNGILDVVTAGLGLTVITGLGNGAFVAPSVQGPTLGFLHSGDTDFNGDGRSDLVAFGDHEEYLLLGAADGTLSPGAPFTTGTQSTLLTVGDVNEDGRRDVVMLGTDVFGMQFALRVGLGTGTGSFSFGSNIPNNVIGERIVLAKIDSDSHLDLLLLHGTDFARGLYFSLGDGAGSFGVFSATVPQIPTTSDPRDIAVADLDKDGDLDLVVAERKQLATYTNNGSGNFVAASYAIPDLDSLDGLNAITVGDFDGDTWLDVAVGHYLGRIHVFHGMTGGAFDPLPERYELRSSYLYTNIDRIETRDIDGDGTLDLLIVGSGVVWLSQGFGNGDFRMPRLYNIPVGSGLTPTSEYVLGDRNADGRVDLATSTRQGIALARQGLCKPFVP